MKKNLTILLFTLFLSTSFDAIAQCGAGIVMIFSSQSDIDNFAINNPGCTQILGDVQIAGNNITNLAGLSGVTSIGGFLAITYNANLTDLSGLSSLTSIGGFLNIDFNNSLTSLAGLSNLNSIGEYISITYNNALLNLADLSGVKHLGRGIEITQNMSLTSTAGLSLTTPIEYVKITWNASLTTLTGAINVTTINKDVTIQYNFKLANLGTWIKSIRDISGSLTIEGNSVLDNLNGLGVLFVGKDVYINANDLLVDITGVSKTTVGRNLVITNCPILPSLPIFTRLTTLGGELNIQSCNKLTDISGISGLTKTGGITIQRNPLLTSIAALSSITSCNGGLSISTNPLITDLAGLSSITYVGGQLSIDNNASLANIDGLSSIISVASSIFISRNRLITNLNGLSWFSSLNGSLEISDNASLASISAIGGLTSINGGLLILNNASLTSLSSLSGLTSINGVLDIRSPVLTSLTGLENINPATISYLSLQHSSQLSYCALPNICTFLSDPLHVAYFTSINPVNCASRTAILATCAPLPIELITFSGEPLSTQNILKWTTATEINNDYFKVERSANGVSFEQIGYVKAKGNNATYDFLDTAPLNISYYRLRQIDFDNKETLSKIVVVVQEYEEINLFPNPTTAILYIGTLKLKQYKIKILNSLGQVIIEKVIENNQIDISDLQNGIYYVELLSESKSILKRIIKN